MICISEIKERINEGRGLFFEQQMWLLKSGDRELIAKYIRTGNSLVSEAEIILYKEYPDLMSWYYRYWNGAVCAYVKDEYNRRVAYGLAYAYGFEF